MNDVKKDIQKGLYMFLVSCSQISNTTVDDVIKEVYFKSLYSPLRPHILRLPVFLVHSDEV